MNREMLKQAAEVAKTDPERAYRMVEIAAGPELAPENELVPALKGEALPETALASLEDAMLMIRKAVTIARAGNPAKNRLVIMTLGSALMNVSAALGGFDATKDEAQLLQKITMRLMREKTKV